MVMLNRIWFFLMIVWRDWEGPISVSTAWEIARIVHGQR
jgi:hypothetical protein